MAAAPITVQVLSGSELQIMAEPGELVAVVRQCVAERLVIGEFQEVKLFMECQALCDDETVLESGMLDSTVQAVLVTSVDKAKTFIQKIITSARPYMDPQPNVYPVELQAFSLWNVSRHRYTSFDLDRVSQCMQAVDVLTDMGFDSEDIPKLLQDFAKAHRFTSQGNLAVLAVLAHMVPKQDSPVEALRLLSLHLGSQHFNLCFNDSVWIKLIDALAHDDSVHAQYILCALASYHSAAAVRATAVGAFGRAPVWAVSHISSLKQIALAVEGDPDDSVRDAAAASARALEDAQMRRRLPAIPPVVRLVPRKFR